MSVIKETNVKNREFIIKSKQNPVKKILCIVLSAVVWVYSLVVFYFFSSAIIGENDEYIGAVKDSFKVTNEDIGRFISLIIVLMIISFSLLLIWRFYNKLRYGNSREKEASSDTTAVEMLNLNLITKENYNKLQENGVIVLNENPIKELE